MSTPTGPYRVNPDPPNGVWRIEPEFAEESYVDGESGHDMEWVCLAMNAAYAEGQLEPLEVLRELVRQVEMIPYAAGAHSPSLRLAYAAADALLARNPLTPNTSDR